MSRPKIGSETKLALVAEAGYKCANPGCANVLTEFHHIREWHVHQTHDPAHMIALCATCHDSISRGQLRITDEDTYSWKRLSRERKAAGHLFVESSSTPPSLLLGSIIVQTTSSGVAVFSERDRWRLAFSVVDAEVMLLHGVISTTRGEAVARVRAGHFEVIDGSGAELVQRPGFFRISHRLDDSVLPRWAAQKMVEVDKKFGGRSNVSLLEMEVLGPNFVRVHGIWCDERTGIVITRRGITLLNARRNSATTLRTPGPREDAATILYAGPVDQAMFQFRRPGQSPQPAAGIVVSNS